MMTDENRYNEELDEADPSIYANVHTWRALAQLGAAKAIPDMVSILRWADQYDDEWVGEEVPDALALFGPSAVPALVQIIRSLDGGIYAIGAALDA